MSEDSAGTQATRSLSELRGRPRWWHYEDEKKRDAVRCLLCHHNCLIAEGGNGVCCTRTFSHTEGFISPYLGRFAAVAVDPIEKKPLRRWRPGTKIYSLGGAFCNAFCPFCQNHELAHPAEPRGSATSLSMKDIPIKDLLERIQRASLSSVAYTYNEPTLQAEYIFAAAPLLKEHGIASVMVTNGLFGEEPREEIARFVDALNIDVKTFDAAVYRRLGGNLDAVKSNVEYLVRRGVHVEITALIVPGVSDSRDGFAAMIDWLSGLSGDIPLHISRYFPAYRYTAPPTHVPLIEKFAEYARSRLKYVYPGNV